MEEKNTLGKEIIESLYENGMVKTWYRDKPEGWKLHSGLWSPVYINLRALGSYPDLFKKVGNALSKLIKNECDSVNRVVGIATAGVPIAGAMGTEGGFPIGYTRKIEGVKTIEDFRKMITSYGQHAMIEGIFTDNDDVILVDDLVTRLTSKIIALEQFKEEMKRRKINAKCDKLLVLLDREQGAQKMAKENGVSLFSLIPFKSKGVQWLKEKFSPLEYEVLSDYLENSDKYQKEEIQEDLKEKAIQK